MIELAVELADSVTVFVLSLVVSLVISLVVSFVVVTVTVRAKHVDEPTCGKAEAMPLPKMKARQIDVSFMIGMMEDIVVKECLKVVKKDGAV